MGYKMVIKNRDQVLAELTIIVEKGVYPEQMREAMDIIRERLTAPKNQNPAILVGEYAGYIKTY
jgi:hypothetical protein